MNETETPKENPEEHLLRALHEAEGTYGRIEVASRALNSLWEDLQPDWNISWVQQRELDAILGMMSDLDEGLGAALKLAIEYFEGKTSY